jgi:putative transposase
MICEIIDVFDRTIIDYYIGNKCKAKNIAFMIKRAYFKRGLPKNLVIRTDNGTQFTSNLFEETCKKYNIHHERIPNATPNKVAHIESFHSLLERECLQYNSFWCLEQAYKEVSKYINWYNNERFHGSLKYLSPMEFYELQKKDGFTKNVVNL